MRQKRLNDQPPSFLTTDPPGATMLLPLPTGAASWRLEEFARHCPPCFRIIGSCY